MVIAEQRARSAGVLGSLIKLLTLILVAVQCTGCSGSPERYQSGALPPLAERPAIPDSDQGDRYPWEVWALGRDLQGEALRNRSLLEADELVRSSQRGKALTILSAIDGRKLTDSEREVLAVRLSSVQLSLDRAKQALQTLSSYFRNQRKLESEVDPRLGLIFGYAYGRVEDYDQSLAWFARSGRSGRSLGLKESASNGVRLLLTSIPDTPLYQLSERWRDDAFIRPLVGQERRRRVQPGFVYAQARGPFWAMGSDPSSLSGSSGLTFDSGGRTVVGMVLPLTGPFASLGRATKQGFEMALEGYGAGGVVLESRDDAGDSVTAVTSVRELITNTGASVVVGPLLTEAALQVADLMRAERRPLLTFAKSGYFAPGDGLYRLGPTAESQVDSLVDHIGTQFTFTRYGLVYPADAAGEEFAELFRARVRDLGLQLVHESTYQKDDFSALFAIAQEAREKNLDAVFMPDSLSSAARFFSYLNVGGGRVVRPLGTASWDNTAELQQSRAIMEGAIFVSPFFRASTQPDITKFVSSYRSRYGTDPDFLAAQGFDAGALVMESLQRVSAFGVSFDEGLRRIGALEGLTGTIEIRPDGALRRQFRVVAFEQGRVRDANYEAALASEGGANEVTLLGTEEERILAVHEQAIPSDRSRQGMDIGGLRNPGAAQ